MLNMASKQDLSLRPDPHYNPALSTAGKPNAGGRLESPNETILLMPPGVTVSTTSRRSDPACNTPPRAAHWRGWPAFASPQAIP